MANVQFNLNFNTAAEPTNRVEFKLEFAARRSKLTNSRVYRLHLKFGPTLPGRAGSRGSPLRTSPGPGSLEGTVARGAFL